jgi:hypothetical protein
LKKNILPRTAKDIFKLNFRDKLIYNVAIWFYKITGLWKHPIQASGDLETMTTLDKIYWLYKTINPIRKSYRNSGIEDIFNAKENTLVSLPQNFSVQNELTLSAVGDLMPHEYLLHSKDTLYNEVWGSIFEKDIKLANLESCITAERSEKLTFGKKAGPILSYDETTFNIIKGIQGRHYDFMATACNHSLDLGIEGVESTIKILKKENIAYNGINATFEDSCKATIIAKKGFRIGILCFTFGLNACKPPKEKPYLINRLNLNDDVTNIDFSQIAKQIKYCQQNEVDFIIAQLHWGYEHELFPRPQQIKVAHQLAEMGIDCIIGHHPHVVQPVEYYQTYRDSNRIVPVFYSLGNLINPFSASYLTLSYMADVILAKGVFDGEGKTYIKHADVVEIVQTIDTKAKTICLKHEGVT